MARIVKHNWHLFDAKGQVVGRFATHIANILRGKYKPTFTGHADMGDHVVIINADSCVLTGRKWEQKIYYKHTGFIGNLHERKASSIRDKYPERILLHAIRGMIPKTMSKLPQMQRLHIFPGENHPYKHLFPNQPIAKAAEKEMPVVESKHFKFSEDSVPELVKHLTPIPDYKPGIQSYWHYLRQHQPEEYIDTMLDKQVRLSPAELAKFVERRKIVKEETAAEKVMDHQRDMNAKFNFGLKLPPKAVKEIKT